MLEIRSVLVVAFVIANLLTASLLAQEVTPSSKVTNSVKVRALPDGGSAEVGKLLPGQKAQLIEDVPAWYGVRLSSGQQGFVSKRWVDLVSGDAGPASDAAGSTPFELHIVDVGVGDGLVLDMGDQEIVFDGGMSGTRFAEYIRAQNLIKDPIELAVVTHADTDHWAGMQGLLNIGKGASPYRVLEFWEPGYDRGCSPSARYDAFIAGMQALVPQAGFRRPLEAVHPPADTTGTPAPFAVPSLPGVEITVLHTQGSPKGRECSYQINNASIVLRVQVGGVTLLLTGDANGKGRDDAGTVEPTDVEAQLLNLELAKPGTLRATVLKAPHHGSETASTVKFLNAVKPAFAVISASTNHHLPRPGVVQRYEDAGAIVLRTDARREAGIDHIVCRGPGNGTVECNYLDQF